MMRTWMLTLALASALALPVESFGATAGEMTMAEWRLHNEAAQLHMLLGAIALTDKLDIVCPQPVTMAEWRAALQHRELPSAQPWIDALLQLMDERGCVGKPVKADT